MIARGYRLPESAANRMTSHGIPGRRINPRASRPRHPPQPAPSNPASRAANSIVSERRRIR